jgi:type VI secretion system ImpA family protein
MPVFAPQLDRLLRPISEEEPGGEYLRYTEAYDAIQEARRADDPSLPQGIWQRELKKADWERLATLCEDAIRNRSKDLYLAVWLVEAWLHRQGAGGVAAGLQLLHGLCANFWEDLYPRVDPEDHEVRAAPFDWLNDRLPVALGIVAISRPEGPDMVPYNWGELVAARAGATGNRREARSRPAGEDGQTHAKVLASIALTPIAWHQDLAVQISAALEATQRLISLLHEASPDAPPSLRRIEEQLSEMLRWINAVLEERGGSVLVVQNVVPESPSNEDVSMPHAEDGVVHSREEAYRLLSVAAEYLLRTEPHSPTPYLVRRAVSWGSMPLSELLSEYTQDGNDLRVLRVLLGLTEEGN